MELHDRAQRKIQIGVSLKNKHECPQIDHSTKGLIRWVENNYLLLKKNTKNWDLDIRGAYDHLQRTSSKSDYYNPNSAFKLSVKRSNVSD